MRLSQRQADGTPLRAHLMAELRATGQPDPLLTARVPAHGQALWYAYCEMAAARPAGLGVSGVASAEIEAWQRLASVRLTPWEVDTLRAIDQAALGAIAPAPASARGAA